jgi:hypothetical protein
MSSRSFFDFILVLQCDKGERLCIVAADYLTILVFKASILV